MHRGGLHQDDAVFEWVAAHFLRSVSVITGVHFQIVSEIYGRTFYAKDVSPLRNFLEPDYESICAKMLTELRERARKSGSLEMGTCGAGLKFFSVPILTGSDIAGFIEGGSVCVEIPHCRDADNYRQRMQQIFADRDPARKSHSVATILSNVKFAVAVLFIRFGIKRVAAEIEANRK